MIPHVTSYSRKCASVAVHSVRVFSAVACLMFFAVSVQAQSAHIIASVSAVDSTVVYPRGVAIDAAGNLYVAQGSSGPILKETPSPTGYTSTVVVNGFNNIAGLAVDSSGNVYVADRYANQVYGEMLSGGVYTQVSIGTGLSDPNGVGVDSSGNVYIADTYNNRVLKEVPAAGTYTQSTATHALSIGEYKGCAEFVGGGDRGCGSQFHFADAELCSLRCGSGAGLLVRHWTPLWRAEIHTGWSH